MMGWRGLVCIGSLVVGLSGCASSNIGSAVGAITGVAGSAITANPAIGFSIGVTFQAATDALVKYVLREWQNDQQNYMANLAGSLPIGQTVSWEVSNTIPYGNEKGQLEVVRDIDNALARCREVLFTVEGAEEQVVPYVTSICHYQGEWHWAVAEPSVERWQGLQ
ncbi:hypothetical protein ACLO87_12840 [Paenalcaligenes sp. Me52]|uniref:hypothetical protein n=1 Tax=Paenalcaligenes sp. Me52 TaxID=3392038 RepID=UPI003D2B082D